jgi:hypothetical protein
MVEGEIQVQWLGKSVYLIYRPMDSLMMAFLGVDEQRFL